jgi:CDP-diacylglycerol---glycerol-3-phosphate 3-phosphatidyltransferase
MSSRKIANLPNLLTLLRIVLTPIFLVMLFAGTWYGKGVAFVVFSIASVTDYFDGRLARSGNQVTAVGRFLDPLADKILVTSALIAFVFDHMVSFWLVVPIVVRDIAITGLRIYGLSGGRQMVTSKFAKWKTAVQLFAVIFLLLLTGVEDVVRRFNPETEFVLGPERISVLANTLVAAVLLLTVLSGVQYLTRPSFSREES